MFADIMPPPIFTIYGAFGWVPTVELTVQVRRKPAGGPASGATHHAAGDPRCRRDRYRDLGYRGRSGRHGPSDLQGADAEGRLIYFELGERGGYSVATCPPGRSSFAVQSARSARLVNSAYSVATCPPGRRMSAKPCIQPSSNHQ